MENILKLYTYVDGVNDTPFPSEEEQVQIIDFKFDASRMAGAPTIEATVKHRLCLDNLWIDKVYASYRGEKYYVKNTPSSSKDNTDERYSHDVELMSERDVLNHVYFIDAVQGDSGIDKVKSNSPSVQFYGDIKEFVGRLNSSLEYAKLDYTAVIDDGIESEIVNVSFEDKYILEALQESFNIFEIPYYFVGKTIHFGYMENAIPYEMEYGNEGALLSISKENANYKAVNRVSGTGSTENIPYYYPNTSPNGDIYCEPITGNTGITSSSDITVINPELFASKISVNDVLTCFLFDAAITSNNAKSTIEGIEVVKIDEVVDLKINVSSPGYVSLNISYLPNIVIDSPLLFTYTSNPKVTLAGSSVDVLSFDADTITFMAKEAGEYSVHFETTTTLITDKYMELKVTVNVSIKGLGFQLVKEGDNVDVYNEKEIGLSFNKQPNSGDKIKQSVKALIPFSQTLMPPVYRETSGAERFYNAKNNTYEIPIEGGYYNFENEYSDNNRKEIIVDFSEIKPSIVGMTNKEGLRIDMFSEFAFDQNDSDEYDSVNNEYLHPYFYGKLRKFDGDYGFNLFDHAQEGSTMTVSMTSGVCGACNFEIGVGEETGKNIIQVDGNGDLIYGEDGKVKTGEPQEKQNDTRTNEVWIALKKDDTTYPSFKPMPNATGNLKPSAGDTFVLTGINMPQSYIEKAENDLKEAIIKYMWLNNTDKFNFSIKFSRIFLKEHPEILDKLNENARIVVKYNNSTYTFYVDNFSVNVNSSEPLPEIEVNLVDTLTIGKNSLQNALDSVKQDILSTIGGADFLKQGLKYFIRKDVDDYANGKLRLKKGASFGSYEKGKKGSNIDEKGYSEFEEVTSREGIKSSNLLWGALGAGFGLVTKDSTGNSYLEIDKLLVRMKAVFNQLEIRELSYSGGNFIFSPAGMKCTRVVETGNVYRCFFTADDGEVAVNNTFKVDDLVRMQEINIKSGVHEGVSNRYFWRRCVGVGDNYIDLSKTDRDTTSDDAPKAGDSLVTLGNKTQVDRQNAIVISVFGEGSPSFIQYQGINDYTLDGKAVTTISPNGNVFTGDFIMKSGNKVEDEIDKTNQSVDQAIQDMSDTINLVKELEQNVGNLQDQIDGVIETWFYDPVPTLSNEPAVNWTTDNDKNNHLGDLYFDKDGKAYRFENRDGVYQWTVIPDTGLEEALRKAQQAQDTADGKRRIFTTQPTTESTYDVGDLWVNATAGSFTNDILRCKVAKTSGQAFSLSHWELASRYTDDTKANEAMQSAEDAQAAADAAQAAADKAQTDATNAKNAADAAQSSANEANSLLSDIANDNKLTAQEKQQTKKEWDIIVSEKPINDASADKFGVSKTEYTNAYNALSTYITPLLQSLTTTSDIVGSTFRETFKNYYDARTELLNNISAKAKELADAAQNTADVAQENADAAKKEAEKALAKAESAQSAAETAQSTADAAATAANNAQNTANTAKTTAEAANSELNKINSDGYISPSEKGALVQQQKDIQSEYADIISQANKYGVSTTSYTTAYNSANTALTKYTATSPTHIQVGADYANIAAYYTARQTILDAISTAAKKVATDAQADADAAKEAAEQAKQDAATAQATANDAKADAAAAKSAADAANAAISDLEANIEGAFSDGIISEAEAIAISKYTNQVNESFTSINATYTEVYGNVYLEGTAKTNLKTKYDALVTKKNALLNAISTAIADGKATQDESQAVDSAFTAYNSAVNSYQTALEQANEAIQAKIKSYADAAQATANDAKADAAAAKSAADAASKAVSDLEANIEGAFSDGIISEAEAIAISKYTNQVNESFTSINATYTEVYGNVYLEGTAKTNLKTKYDALVTKKNALLNAISTAIADGKATQAESQAVDSAFTAYNSAVNSYQTALEQANEAIQAKIKSYADAAQATANDAKADAAAAKSAADAASKAVSDLEANIEGAFSDGIISEAEAIAISKYTNQVNESFTSINATYTEVYGNVYLEGTAKTNLKTKYDALVTKKNALLNAISTAIADGKATQAESQAVDSAFTAYNSAVNSYQTALEQANEAIQAKIKSYADAAQESVDNLQIGGTNLILGSEEGFTIELVETNITEKGKWFNLSKTVSAGETVTAQMEIKGKANVNFYFGMSGGNYPLLAISKDDISVETFKKVAVVYTVPRDLTRLYICTKYGYSVVGDFFEIKEKTLKLEIGNKPTDWSPAPEDVQSDIDAAMQEAANAKAAADTAQIDAKDANDRLNSWASDSVISPTEKQAIKNEQTQVRAEKNEIVADARKYSIATTTYVNAFNAYDAVLTKYSASSPENITIGTDFNSTQTTYYAERTKILGLIADGAKKYVDDIQVGTRNLWIYKNIGSYREGRINNKINISVNKYRVNVTEHPSDLVGCRINTSSNKIIISGKTDLSKVVCYYQCYNDGGSIQSQKNTSVNATAGKFEIRLSIPDLTTYVNIGIGLYPYQSTYYLEDISVVEGDKVVGFTPSPEDVDANLEEYKTEVSSQFEKTDEKISQSVTETKTYTDSAIGNIKVGSVNLISRKMMMSINDKPNSGTATWGRDIDGVYIDMMPEHNTVIIDNLKPNTQYVVSIRFKGNPNGGNSWRPNIMVEYSDGTIKPVGITNNSTLTRSDYVTEKEKTVTKLKWNVANYGINYSNRIYAISLIEGNQIPTEIPEAVEDIQDLQTGSTNLITDRQNIITKSADFPDYTTYSSELNSKGEREVTVTAIKVANKRYARYVWLQNNLSEQVYPGFYVFSFDYKTNHGGCSIRLGWRNTDYSNNLHFYKELENTNGEWKRGWFICDWRTGTTQKLNIFYVNPNCSVVGNYVAYRNIKLVRGNRGWDDSVAPQDIEKDIDAAAEKAAAAQESANAAKTAADTAQSTANTAKTTAEAANSELSKMNNDGYISPSEKSMLKQQQKDIQTEYNDIISQAGKYSIATSSYTTAYNAANSALTKYTAASPTHITVGSDYANISSYYTARQTILNSISTAAKKVATDAQAAADAAQSDANKALEGIGLDGGRMLYKDPTFTTGYNSILSYNNAKSTGTVTVSRISKPSDAPTTSTHALEIKSYGKPRPGFGGFSFGTSSRANAVFITKIIAKIPEGFSLKFASNAVGDEEKYKWLTSDKGTGKYETYLFKLTCGSTGSFSSTNYFYLTGSGSFTEASPLLWYLAYATVFDMTDDGYGDLVSVAVEKTIAGINNEPGKVTVFATKQQYNDQQELISQLDSSITVQAGRIDSVVSDISGLNTRISQTESDIELKVDASGIISAINLSKEGVAIKGDRIEITGQTVFKDSNGNKVNIFGQGDKVLTVNNGVFSVSETGLLTATNADIQGKITATSGKIGGFNIGTGAQYWLSSGGMGLSGGILIFEDSERTVMVGSGPGESTAGSPKTCWLQIGSRSAQIADADSIALFASAQGKETSFKKNYAIYTDYGDIRFGQGRLMFKPYVWGYVKNGAIPVQNKTIIHVLGNTGSDNPCYLDRNNAIEGQVVIIVNRTTNHRLNIKGTLMGDHWIPDGSLGVFVYVAGNQKWVPLRM